MKLHATGMKLRHGVPSGRGHSVGRPGLGLWETQDGQAVNAF
jgi:hypothetical protein